MKRASGVLLSISSLPGDFGIGDLGQASRHFLQAYLDMGFHYWQVLPISTIGAGNSPYSGYSLRAGNYLYIDPHKLQSKGLITHEDIEYIKYRGEPYLVNYEHAKWAKKYAIKKAFSKFTDWTFLNEFVNNNVDWLKDYALFMCLKEDNNVIWSEWEDCYKYRDNNAIKAYSNDNMDRLYYYYYEQYLFMEQWLEFRRDANELGIGIIGDIPIYCCYDSVEVWSNPNEYLLNKNLVPTKVAGVPPDYFAEEGQLWNNPIYNYSVMKKNNYKTLRDRFSHLFKWYDYTRIDHFRGFYKYWAVPYGATSAKEGQWYNGPKMNLFKYFKGLNIIAEDLGIIDDEVRKFLKTCGYPGMKVMQFGFMDDDSIHLPHYYSKNCVAYTGTHDNDTTLGWLYKLDEFKRNYVLKYCSCEGSGWGAGGGDCPATKAFIKTLLASSANLAIVAFQDLCGYGSDTRMNIPGVAEGNWLYRSTYGALYSIDVPYMHELNDIYGRNRAYTTE